MNAVWLLVLALATLSAPATRLSAQNPEIPARDPEAEGRAPRVPSAYLGYTFCRDGVAESRIRADVVGTPREEEVEAHEAVHRRQAAAFATCEAYAASLRTARRVIEAEIPAYCAQHRVAVAHGAEPVATMREYALRISAQAGAMENRLDVLAMLERACR